MATTCTHWTYAWVTPGAPAMQQVFCNRVIPPLPAPQTHEGKHTYVSGTQTFAWWHGADERPME